MDELTAREFQAVRELIAANDKVIRERLDQYEQRHTERVQSYLEQRQTALDSLNKRLNEMNQFRSAMADQAALLATRREVDVLRAAMMEKAALIHDQFDARLTRVYEAKQILDSHLETSIQRPEFEAKITPLHESIERIQRPNWSGLAVIVSISLASLAGMWLVIGLEIDREIAPLSIQTAQTHALATTTMERLEAWVKELRPREYWETNSARMAVIEDKINELMAAKK